MMVDNMEQHTETINQVVETVHMICPKCGADLEEGHLFCPKCGQKIGANEQNDSETSSLQPRDRVKQKDGNKLITPIVAIALVIVIAIIGYIVLRGPSVDEIILSEDSAELRVDESMSMDYTISPAEAEDVEITWSTSDEAVATVSEDGEITAVGEGSCTITVEAKKKTDSLTLIVTPAVDEIVLSKDSVELRINESLSVGYTISPTRANDAEVAWSTSNESVAVVDGNGEITAIGEGSCTITAIAGKQSDSLTVTVKSAPDFQALYDEYCDSIWAKVGTDGSYLSIDTNPDNEDDNGLAYYAAYLAIENINVELGLPESLLEDMGSTTSLMGRQTETFDEIGVTVSWSYHPDNGLEVTYKYAD